MKQTSHFKIGLDFRMGVHTGIGTYLRGLVEGFANIQNPAVQDLALFSPNISVKSSFSRIFFDAPIYSITEQWKYPEFVRLCRLWHAPHYNIPLWKGKTHLVATVHDIIHWIYKDQLTFAQKLYAETMLTRTVKTASHILTVSESSKKDLIQHFHADPNKVSVIYNGVAPDFFPRSTENLEPDWLLLKQKYQLPDSFFLYVGMLKPHKNIMRLMRVYHRLFQNKKIQSRLVIIGQGAPDSPEIRMIKDLKSEIIHLPKIDYGELPIFYNQAHALVHPSLYEGFGLTVLEALACGTPVLTTSRASLPEVGGKAARYIDGEDEDEMEKALEEWDADTTLRDRLGDLGLQQACKFSWDKAARETCSVYSRILNS